VHLAARTLGAKAARLADLQSNPDSLDEAYAVFRGIYTRAESATLTAHYTGIAPVAAAPAAQPPPDISIGDAISRLELTRYMRNQLLRDADAMSMAWGIELRVPFLDHRFIEALMTIPSTQRLHPKKGLLLRAVPEIPGWIAQAPKRGFLLPMEQWLAGDWGHAFSDLARRAVVPAGSWYRKWSVLAFEHWFQNLSGQPGGAMAGGASAHQQFHGNSRRIR